MEVTHLPGKSHGCFTCKNTRGNVVWKSILKYEDPRISIPLKNPGRESQLFVCSPGRQGAGVDKGDITPLRLRDTSPAPREHSNKGQAPGRPLSWTADAVQASHSHYLAWKQGFPKHTFLVNKPKSRKTSLESNEGTPYVSQACPGARTWKEGCSRPERRHQGQCSSHSGTDTAPGRQSHDLEVRSPGINSWQRLSQLTMQT